MSTRPAKPRKILIRSTNWIGDAVMSLAAIREIRSIFPEAHLSLYAKEWVASLFQDQGLIDELITFGNNDKGLPHLTKLRGYDTAILLQNAVRSAILVFLARIPNRIGYATHGRGFLLTRKAAPRIKQLNRHQIYYYLDLLYQTGLSSTDYLNTKEFKPDISLSPPTHSQQSAWDLLEEHGVERSRPIVGINPGAFFGPAKRWLTDRYAALGDRLVEDLGAKILIFGSRDELRIAEEIDSLMKHQAAVLAGKTELTTLIALIDTCSVFITNDSGPMHLAAALGTSTVAIFGSTDEVATGPFSEKARVVHKHVECSPCLRRTCPIDLRCFKRITVDEVFEIVQNIVVNG